ncbi:hypothetical protein [Thalassoglobus sp.]|uniref:hypothetical protein n=1 Tax=Thalassoglobus sp. TaxID=2795869 RepID=UPI003AA8AFE8
MTLKIPEWLTGDARDNYVSSLKAAETGNYEPVLSIASYGYSETGTGGVVAGGCSQWFESRSAADGYVTTLTVPCADDGYLDTESSVFDFDSTTLRIGGDGTNQYQTWFHFCSLPIPAGATIVDAYIDFPASDGYEGVDYNKTSYINFACEDADSPTPPSSNSDGQARPRTAAKEHQRIFNTNWDDTYYDKRTPSLIGIVQEVVDRAGWQSGNNLTVWMDYTTGNVSPSGYALAASNESGNGPRLYVSYTMQPVTELTFTCDGDGYYSVAGTSYNDSATSFSTHDPNYYNFFHFSGVTVPENGRLVMANLELTATSGESGAGGGTIWLVDEDDSPVITDRADGISRSLTTAKQVQIDRMGWEAGAIRKDANFADVAQEVIDRAGWSSGNDLQVITLHETGSISDRITVHSSDSTNSAYHPTLRLMYVKKTIQETGIGGGVAGGSSALSSSVTPSLSGGVQAGGTSLDTMFVLEDGAGGAVTGGSSLHSKSTTVTTTGGVVLAGESLSQVTINVEGGSVVGGASEMTYQTTITTEGGVVLSGLATIQSGIISAGGAVVGGSSTVNSSTTVDTTGGAVVSPKSKFWTEITEQTSGGVEIVQPVHSTGYTHRMSLTIPQSSLEASLTMMVGVRVPAVFNDAVVTSSNGSVLNSEIRETTDDDTCLFFRADLSDTTDNEFLVYFNMEDA